MVGCLDGWVFGWMGKWMLDKLKNIQTERKLVRSVWNVLSLGDL